MFSYIQQIQIIINFLLLMRMFIQCPILHSHTDSVRHLLGAGTGRNYIKR